MQLTLTMVPGPGPGPDPDPGPDPGPHLSLTFTRSAYLLNHGRGDWMYARWQLHSLRPRAELAAQLVATHQMVGLRLEYSNPCPKT